MKLFVESLASSIYRKKGAYGRIFVFVKDLAIFHWNMAKFITNKGRIDAIRIEEDNSNGMVD